jgi:hypothetical protein
MPLHYVDPHNVHGRRYRAVESFGRSRHVTEGCRAVSRVHRAGSVVAIRSVIL